MAPGGSDCRPREARFERCQHLLPRFARRMWIDDRVGFRKDDHDAFTAEQLHALTKGSVLIGLGFIRPVGRCGFKSRLAIVQPVRAGAQRHRPSASARQAFHQPAPRARAHPVQPDQNVKWAPVMRQQAQTIQQMVIMPNCKHNRPRPRYLVHARSGDFGLVDSQLGSQTHRKA